MSFDVDAALRASQPTPVEATKADAIRAWNTRVASEQSRVGEGVADDLNGAVVAITQAAIMHMDANEDNDAGHAAFERRITPILTALGASQPTPAEGLATQCSGDTQELLPCPFCEGEVPKAYEGDSGWWHVSCVGAEGCGARNGNYRTRTEAIRAWNTRSTQCSGEPKEPSQ